MVFSKVKLYCWTWVGFMFQEQNTHRDDMKSIYVPNCDVKRSVQNVVVAPAKFQKFFSPLLTADPLTQQAITWIPHREHFTSLSRYGASAQTD
jgi:hypothetical protein